MQRKAYAKLNWYLDVTGKRPDGYHLLDMINQRLALHDVLAFHEADELTLDVLGDSSIPAGDDNLVLRAARRLQEISRFTKGARIALTKNIPAGAGLGGGSADAAATLLALNDLWGTGLDLHELQKIGEVLGADIPYCLAGGVQRVQGIGERMTPLKADLPAFHLIIAKPGISLATRDVFAELSHRDPASTLTPQGFLDALIRRDFAALRTGCQNRLQAPATRLAPEITGIVHLLYQNGASYAQMTGAGSAVYGVFETIELRDEALLSLQPLVDVCIATETIPY